MAEQKNKIKFSIVTPTFNSGRHLEQTISSVVSQQGDFDVEYIIVDNASTDNTLEIAEVFRIRQDELSQGRAAGRLSINVISEPDSSMYEALHRGFSLATGNVFAWINSDDFYLPGAFNRVAHVLSALPEVRWLKGVTSYVDENGENLQPGQCYLYAQDLIRQGLYGREAYFIQQDSVFWRSELWFAVGGVDPNLRLAGDYDLWLKFSQQTPLYALNFPVSCFRRVEGQLSEDMPAYRAEQALVSRRDRTRIQLLRLFFTLLEPKLPATLNFLLFRLLSPAEPLYYIDGEIGSMVIKTSNKYVV